MRRTLTALALTASALLAVPAASGAVPEPTRAATAAAEASSVCTAGSGTQGAERHCGGYFPSTVDGVTLRWQVYLPDPAVWGPGPYPTVLDYSGYEPATTFFDGIKGTFITRGYAVAGINIRGTGCSGGRFDYFEPLQWQDGYDGVEFLARQPWSDGAVAMVGKSYPGITPLYVAPTRPPSLRAIVPGAFFGDLYRDVAYPGGVQDAVFAGVFSLASQPFNTLDQVRDGVTDLDQTCLRNQALHAANPVTNPFVTLNAHPFDDPEPYHARGPNYLAKHVQVPVLAQLAWQDEELAARGIDYVDHLPATTPWRAVLSNGDHGEYYGPAVLAETTRFLSYYVKREVPAGDACRRGTYAASLACYEREPRVTVLGDVGPDRVPTYRHTYDTWPATEQVDRLFLHGDGRLDRTRPTAGDPGARYAYTPVVGTNSYGRAQDLIETPVESDFWQEQPPAGTVAQFTTPAFPEDTLYTGTASADLWLSSTAPDTDLEVMLTELRPDGQGGWLEQYVQKGRLRASHRALDPARTTALRPYQTHQAVDARPLVPGEPTLTRVEVFPFSQVFREGRRLRLTVQAPSVKPEAWGFLGLPVPAVNTLLTDLAHPSSLALPLVPARAAYAVPAERSCLQDAQDRRSITNQPCRPTTVSVP